MTHKRLCVKPQVDPTLTTALFSQQTTSAEHSLPVPTPVTVMGEQSRPRRTSWSVRTMPSRPNKRPPTVELACDASVRVQYIALPDLITINLRISTLWQHWIGPVVHWLAGVTAVSGTVT
jgi:hypothetical protein